MNDYIRSYIERIRRLPVAAPPEPWKQIAFRAVGGLTEVGFGNDTELLLVVSHNGRGLFDCKTGELISRDSEPDGLWHQPLRLLAAGIGSLAGQQVRLAGLLGGGLLKAASDGWSLELVYPDWPDGSLILQPPGASVFLERGSAGCLKIADVEELRAFGFSSSGRTFVVAESHTLRIFGR